jgi:uncharacterized protein YjdB
MKKTNKLLVAFASLGMVIAGGAAIAVATKAAVKTSAVTGYSLAYDCDLSVASAVTATSNKGAYYGYTTEYTQTILDSTNNISKQWKAYSYNPNNWSVAGTRFGGKTGTLTSALTNGPTGVSGDYCGYMASTTAFTEAITKVEFTSMGTFGTASVTKNVYLQMSANANFSSATNQTLVFSQGTTQSFTLTGTANQYYRLVIEKTATSSTNSGTILSHIKFYKTVETVDPTGITVTGTSTMTVGGTQTLDATVAPTTATDKTVTWSSSNESVATVSAAGVVTAINNGTVVITATSNAVNTVKGTLTITVSGAPSSTARYIVNGVTSGLPTSYPSGANYTSQGVVFYAANAMYSSSYYQIQLKKDAAACYYNVTAMGADITALTINISNYASAATDFVVSAGSAANPSTTLTATVTNLAYKYTPAAGARYFKIAGSSTGTTYINSIIVDFGATETAATAAAYVLGIAPDVDSAKDYCIGVGGNYSLAKAIISSLSAAELTTFQDSTDATIVSARTRYVYWAGRYGDTTPYAATYGTAAIKIGFGANGEDSTSTIIVLASMAIVLAGGAYLYIRRRKQA